MEIAASDANQPKSVSPRTDPLALTVREARTVDFNGPQTLVGEHLELELPEIMGRMCERGNTAGSLDQNNRVAAIEPRFIHAGGATIPEVTCEHLARTGHLARPCQVIGQMAPTQAGAGKDAPNRVQID